LIGLSSAGRARIAPRIGQLLACTLLIACGTSDDQDASRGTSEAMSASTVGGAVSRGEALARAQRWVDLGVMYSQDQALAFGDGDGHNYRPDCSGFVSMAWHLPKKSNGWDLNTGDFGSYSGKTYIGYDELLAGDAILGVAYGHIVLFDRWTDGSRTQMWIYQENQSGTPANHVIRSRSWYIANGFLPIRYNNMIGTSSTGGASDILAVGDAADGVDLLVARSNGQGFDGLANRRHASGFGWGGMKVVAGDFNGDGRWDIAAIGNGVDGHSVDLLVALADGSGGFAPVANWRHADGFGWGGMKVVAGDFNGDGRWDIAAIGNGVDGHSVDLLVATSTGASFNPIGNWRHADGFGWGGMMPVAGDFNGDGRWDIAAIGNGVDGHSVDLLVATSTGASFNPIGNWRHADGFGWGGMMPVAGDFNGDGRWDIAAIGNGVDGHSVDLLVATSTGASFNPIGNWRHADGFGWAGMKPVAGDFNGDGRWDIGAIGDGVDGASIDLLVATSTGGGFNAIANWLHAPGFGWAGLSPASL
jgi:hypothetical protein